MWDTGPNHSTDDEDAVDLEAVEDPGDEDYRDPDSDAVTGYETDFDSQDEASGGIDDNDSVIVDNREPAEDRDQQKPGRKGYETQRVAGSRRIRKSLSLASDSPFAFKALEPECKIIYSLTNTEK